MFNAISIIIISLKVDTFHSHFFVRMMPEFTQPPTEAKNTEFPSTTQPFMHWKSV